MPGEPKANLGRVDEVVDSVLEEYSEYDTAIDGALAEEIHRNLHITPEQRATRACGIGWLSSATPISFVIGGNIDQKRRCGRSSSVPDLTSIRTLFTACGGSRS
nr:hypothetical protein [Haloterrigena sp. H1]